MLIETETPEYTIPISKSLSLRLYADTRPHYHRISDLQKGLIFVYKGAELIGEGTGFGVPVVRRGGREYFSGSSTVHTFQKSDYTTVIKHFGLDMAPEKRFRKATIENRIMRKLTMHMAELYQKHRHWRLLALEDLSKSIGVQTNFARVKPKGTVTMTYQIDPPRIHVKADFELKRKDDLQKLFLLNEQGARFFRRYYDSTEKVLSDQQIGEWENVDADWACISNINDEVGFRLWKVKDSVLRRGREFLEGILDWAGLDYEVSPEKTCFNYDIEIVASPE